MTMDCDARKDTAQHRENRFNLSIGANLATTCIIDCPIYLLYAQFFIKMRESRVGSGGKLQPSNKEMKAPKIN